MLLHVRLGSAHILIQKGNILSVITSHLFCYFLNIQSNFLVSVIKLVKKDNWTSYKNYVYGRKNHEKSGYSQVLGFCMHFKNNVLGFKRIPTYLYPQL